MDADVAYLT